MKITTAIFAATALTLSATAHADPSLDRSGNVAPTSAVAPTTRADSLGDIFARVLWPAPAEGQVGSNVGAVHRGNPAASARDARDDLYQIFAEALWNGDRPGAQSAEYARPTKDVSANLLPASGEPLSNGPHAKLDH